MANIINQLEISGITYDIQDASAQAALSGKQDALVSGVNIKTINSESLLGSGNIVIESGTGDAYTKAETDALLANKADTSAMTEDIEAAVSGKANSSDVYLKSSTSSSTEINNALEAKADASTTYSKIEVDTAINAAVSGKADTSAVTEAIDAATSGKADTSAVTEAIDAAVSGKADTSAVTAAIDAATSGKQDTLEYYQESSVDKYANIEVDESEVSSSLQVSSEGVSIDYLTSDLNEGTSQTSNVLLDNDGVKFESSIDDGLGNLTTTMLSVAPSGASINDDAIVTESVLDAAVSGKADTSAVTAAIDAATSGKADSADVYTTAQTSSSTEISTALAAKANTASTLTGYGITDAYTTAQTSSATEVATALLGKANASDVYTTAQTSSSTEISTALSAKADTATTSSATQVSTALAAKQDTLVSGTNIKTINNESLLGSGNITIQGGGGANVVELTQSAYDALTAKSADTFYVITDATPIDTSTFYTTAQTSSSTEIATALSGKQNVLTAGTGIDITNDVISVTGGGGGGTIDAALDANSPNAVANSAITAGISAVSGNVITSYTNSYDGQGRTGLWAQAGGTGKDNISIFASQINNKNIIAGGYSNRTSLSVNLSLVETSAITTTLTSSSTDSQVPSAKAVYDIVGNINALLSAI